jgi:hypothetical protein
MCDYSLHLVSSRPAEAGETLTVTGFPGTDTRGFASPSDPNTAVCLRPGTELVFEEGARVVGALFTRRINDRLARFRQIDIDKPQQHHDALEFANGKVVLLTNLVLGQRAAVLQLPADHSEKPVEKRTAAPAMT